MQRKRRPSSGGNVFVFAGENDEIVGDGMASTMALDISEAERAATDAANRVQEERVHSLPELLQSQMCQHGCCFSTADTCKKTHRRVCTCWHCDGRCLTSKFGGLSMCPYCVDRDTTQCMCCPCCGQTHSSDGIRLEPEHIRKFHIDYEQCLMCQEADEGNSHDSHKLCRYHTAHETRLYYENRRCELSNRA